VFDDTFYISYSSAYYWCFAFNAFRVLWTTLSFFDCSANDSGFIFEPSSSSSCVILGIFGGAGGSGVVT
jgi:hypothetical protein